MQHANLQVLSTHLARRGRSDLNEPLGDGVNRGSEPSIFGIEVRKRIQSALQHQQFLAVTENHGGFVVVFGASLEQALTPK